MNRRREAMLWAISTAMAVIIGLIVVWAAIGLAYGRPDTLPLYFVAAPYNQDDYSAEGLNVARLNPLDPALEQEVILEDQALSPQVPHENYDEMVAPSVPIDMSLLAPTNMPQQPTPTNMSIPTPANVPQPAPTIAEPPTPDKTGPGKGPKEPKAPKAPKAPKGPKEPKVPKAPKEPKGPGGGPGPKP